MDNISEDIALAVELIRQLENLEYPEESILSAIIYVTRDTLNKLPDDGTRGYWQQRMINELMDAPVKVSTH